MPLIQFHGQEKNQRLKTSNMIGVGKPKHGRGKKNFNCKHVEGWKIKTVIITLQLYKAEIVHVKRIYQWGEFTFPSRIT